MSSVQLHRLGTESGRNTLLGMTGSASAAADSTPGAAKGAGSALLQGSCLHEL